LSCFGETIMNLEWKLGYVHRGLEKRLTEVSWKKSRLVAESSASDSATANALAHAIAIESILDSGCFTRANLFVQCHNRNSSLHDSGPSAYAQFSCWLSSRRSRLILVKHI
jgi:hypothetical protein